MNTLFPLEDAVPSPVQPAEVQWSFSRRQLLFQCPRKFYYHYYGASSRTAHEEQDKERLRELKPITNLNLRAGDIVDLVIRTFFTRPDISATWGLSRLRNWALAILQKDRAFNLGDKTLSTTSFPIPTLLEFACNFGDADERYQAAEAKVVSAIENFLGSEAYAKFRNIGNRGKVQQKVTVRIDGSRATGKLDLAFMDQNCHHIVDWKIGSQGSSDDSLQVGFYGLWATTQTTLRIPIQLHMAYLGDGVAKTFCVPQDVHPRQVRARITQDLIIMRDLHAYGIASKASAFTPCLQSKICAMCQYRSVCLQGSDK